MILPMKKGFCSDSDLDSIGLYAVCKERCFVMPSLLGFVLMPKSFQTISFPSIFDGSPSYAFSLFASIGNSITFPLIKSFSWSIVIVMPEDLFFC